MTVATAELDTYDDFDWGSLSDVLPPASQQATPPAEPEPPKPTMQDRVDAEIDANPLGHQWVAEATISVPYAIAKRASFRGSFRSPEGHRVDALEVICHCCRRPFDEVADSVHDCAELGHDKCAQSGLVICPAQVDNTHLIGGDQREREKRIKHPVRGAIVYAVIDRRGLNGYTVNDGR